MSNENNNSNEPAYPILIDNGENPCFGLTKREAAEIAAMQGLCVNTGRNGYNTPEAIAKGAAEIADKLIKGWK